MRKLATLTIAAAALLLPVVQVGALEIADSVSVQQTGLTTLTESFTTVTTSGGDAGLGDDTTLVSDNTWVIQNRSFNSESDPAFGSQTWQQGNPQAFGAQNFEIDGQNPVNGFVQVNFLSAQDDASDGLATVDNYLITPELDLSQGGTFSFWTRTTQGAQRATAVQVLVGSGLDVTTYTTLTTIGDLEDRFGYPGAIGGTTWEQFVLNVTGGTNDRIAFRFFSDVDRAGSSGNQAGLIGIDTVSFEAVPEPATGFGAVAIAALAGSTFVRRWQMRHSR